MCRLGRGFCILWLCIIGSPALAVVKCTDKNSGIVATRNAKVTVTKKLAVTTGKVEKSKNGTLEGTKIVLNAAQLIQNNATNAQVTGVYNPDTEDLVLENQTFTASPGNVAQNINLSGNSLLEGTPTNFADSVGVNIADASSVLNLALTSPLGTNIGMNGGTVKLQGSTKLGDGKTPVGNGTLEFNNNSLSLGGTPVTLSSRLLLKKAADLIFNSKVMVTGQLTFDGDGQVSGNGNLLDLSQGGTIAIRPNTTIYMTNLKVRGLGLGKIVFYDDTSQLYLSNVEIEMDRNYSVTIGGIYMEGPTNIVTKNNRLAFTLRGSLTVDGIALTYDTLTYTNGNNILPLVANDPRHKFVTVLNDGVIRRLDNFDIISANSSAIVKLSQGGSDGALSRANSNALLYFHRVDSNALLFGDRTNSGGVVYLTALTRSSSGSIGYLTSLTRATSGSVGYLTKFARANSGGVTYLTALARTSSNALLFGNRVTSGGVVYLTALARSSSGSIGYLTSLARATSGSVGYLTKFARANSGGVMYLTALARTSSNALLFGNRVTSGSVVYLTALARSSSGSIGYLTNLARATSGSVGYLTKFARANSGGVTYLTALARTSSNALLFGNRVTSGSVVYLTVLARSSSGSIGYLTNLARATSGSVGYLTKFARANSGGVTYLTALARTSSNALLFGDRVSSGSVVYLTALARSSSGSIGYLTNLARATSGSVGYLTKFARANSGGVTYLTALARTSSNALLFGDRVSSNTMLYGFEQIGAELDAQAEMIRTHSNSFVYGITNNSAVIVLLDQQVRTDSNTLMYGINNNSNALLYLHRADSNAVMALTTGQGVLAQAIRTDSNASAYGIKNNSNALLFLHRADSNAVMALTTGQGVLAQAIRTDSNASAYGIKNNSNALLYLHRADSNAVMALTTGQGVLAQAIRTDSNASAYGIKNNSNVLLYLHRVDSNAVMALTTGQGWLAQTVRTDSNASMYGIKNNSNTMLYGLAELGSEVGFMGEVVRTHSNAFVYGIANNSNAIVALAQSEGSALSKANSNALLYLHRVDSSAIVKVASGGNDLILQNSKAIVRLDNQVQTAFGPEPLTVTEPVYALHSDLYLSDDHFMLVQPAAGPCIIDGVDHTISFANALTNLIQIAPNVEVTLTNVVLKNYSESGVLLGDGSKIMFGDNVRIEVDSDQPVMRDWVFAGNNAVLVGNGNRLTLGIGSIIVRPSGSLHLKTIGIEGLKRNNLRCDAMSSSLVLEASTLYLTNNMSFSTGLLDIAQDVRVTGTAEFAFSSNPLIIEPSSALHLDGVTFAYQPPTNNRDAVMLVDRSSVLALDSCTLQSTMTGMRLTRGTLVVDGANKLVNTGALSLSEGFGIGNGNAEDDLTIQIKPGASLNLMGGIIDYANVN